MGFELFVLSGVCAALGLHPFLSYPASLALISRTAARPLPGRDNGPASGGPGSGGPASGGRIALCVCAYNEERIIRHKAENMLALQRDLPELKLLVYVDAATDRTAEILLEYADRIHTVVSPMRTGKTHGMNTLVAATQAEFVVFSDANVMFAPDAIHRLLVGFTNPDVGCVCGHLVYTRAEGSTTAAIGSLYWRLEEWIKEMESRTGSTMGADGSIFAIRRALHTPPPPDIIDDMFVSLSILCDGHRVVRAADAFAYEELVSRPGEEFRRKIRIACQAFNVHRLLAPRLRRLGMLDRYKYISHKMLRWVSVYLLAISGLSLLGGLAATESWTALAIMLGVGVAVLLFGLVRPASLPGKLIDVALALAATGFGVLRSLCGDRFQTWTPPASARSSS